MMQIVIVGISYKTAPVELREQFAFSQSSLETALPILHSNENIEECAILSTCNRVEIYAVSDNVEKSVVQIKEFLSEFHSISQDRFSECLFIFTGQMAVRHLFKVASSIDSMVIGEPQILGQMKQAYRIAKNKKTVGLILNRLFNTAFFIAKKVRTETNIGTQAVSISYAAVELAKRIFDDLSKRTIMLVGTGEMGELTAKHLIKAGITELIIASRNFGNAEALAQKLNGNPVSMDEIYYFLKNVDIVISATGASEYLINTHHVRDALKLRKNEPIFLIDIAVPRDIDPRVEEIENIYLYDIDDLKGVVDENIHSRKENAQLAVGIVAHGERNFIRWLDSLKAIPTIVLLKKRFEDIKELEIQKAINKFENLSAKDERVLNSLVSGIIGKILYHPLTNLKKETSSSLGALYMESIRRIFELDNEYELLNDDEEESVAEDWE